MLPKARTEGLTVRELADETLIYDLKTLKAHCLNPTCARIWRACDGATPVARLAERMQAELGIERGQAVVQLALEQLTRRGLLEQPVQPLMGKARLSRRQILKTLAAAAVALPVVMTLGAPPPAAGQSPAQSRVEGCRTIFFDRRNPNIFSTPQSDGTACTTTDGRAGTCQNGQCVAMQGMANCKHGGETCAANGECCSGFCLGGRCSGG